MSKSKTLNNLKTDPSQGALVILSAPSGCGKTTITERLLKRHPDWVRSISATTRPAREDETHGVDYFFVTPEEFRRMDERGELLESAHVFSHQYGTPRRFIEEQLGASKVVLLAIDVQGTAKVKKTTDLKGALLTIFVLPPSVKVLRERLEGRHTDAPEEIERRISMSQEEIKEAGWYDFTVVNQNLDQTITEIEERIEKFQKERSLIS